MSESSGGIDKYVLYPSIVLGLFFVFVYLIKCIKAKASFELRIVVGIILSCSGIVAGSLLMLSMVWSEIKAYLASLDLYTFIGGLAVVITSIQSLLSAFSGNFPEHKERNGAELEFTNQSSPGYSNLGSASANVDVGDSDRDPETRAAEENQESS